MVVVTAAIGTGARMIVGRVVAIIVVGGVVGGDGLERVLAGGRDGSGEVVRGVGDGGRIAADRVGGGTVLGKARTSSDG